MKTTWLLGEETPSNVRAWAIKQWFALLGIALMLVLLAVFTGCKLVIHPPSPPRCELPAHGPTCSATGGVLPCFETASARANLCAWVCEDGERSDPIDCNDPRIDPPPPPEDPVPAPVFCSIDGEPGPALDGYEAQLQGAVFAAIERALPGCHAGGTCLLGDMTRREWQGRVIAELKVAGLCAGEHEPGVTDEIAVATSPTAPREGWHIFAGDDSSGPVPPGGARRTVAWKYTGAYAPPPEAPACGEPTPPPVHRFAMGIHQAFCANVDSTALVKDAAYCAKVGFPGRLECPVRPEGRPDRVACERQIIGPRQTWSCDGCQVFPCDVPGNCECGGKTNTNPAQAIVVGHGRVITCTADGKACGSEVIP